MQELTKPLTPAQIKGRKDPKKLAKAIRRLLRMKPSFDWPAVQKGALLRWHTVRDLNKE